MNIKSIYSFILSLLFTINIYNQVEFPPDASLPNYLSGRGNEITPTIIPKDAIPPNAPDIRIHPSTYHQSELSVTISPINEQVLLASANISESSTGVGIGIGYYYSINGGNTWNGSDQLPTGCSNASSPAVVIDNNGYFYIGSINFSYGQGLMRSTDNGASWTYFTVANAQQPAPLYVLDKNHLAVDNTGGQYDGYLYSAWSNFYYINRRIEFARSTNHGQTWETTAVLSSGLADPNYYAHQGVNLQVGSDGTIYACWAVRDRAYPFTERGIGFNKSTDGGQTWDIPQYAINDIYGIRAPDGYSAILSIGTNSFPVMAVDNQGDKIYIAWVNVGVPGVNTGDPDIYILSSENQGATWSTPVRVNSDQTGNGAIQFHCWLSVDQITGDVYAVFYDNTENINTNMWRFYVSKSFDEGQTFTDFAVSDDAFSIYPIWNYYFGNQSGLTARSGYVYPLWNAQNPSSISQAWLSKTIYSLVNIDQKKDDGSRLIGYNIGRWNGLNFYNKQILNNPSTISVEEGSTEVLKGYQNPVAPTQKYNRWVRNNTNDEADVKNHHPFTIQANDNNFTSKFKRSYESVTIKNEFLEAPGLNPVDDEIQFSDPWFIDYPDPSYGNNKRNKGLDNPTFYFRLSPFQPDFLTSYNGNYYLGVFLDQPIISGRSYYKVGMLPEQTITVNGQLRKFFPYKWTGSGVNFQDEYARQTGVVFTTSNATATALLKGQLMSNDQNGVKNPSQRKMVRTGNGQYHVVYESMGTVFYTYSLTNDFYGTWSADEPLHTHGKNPAIDYDGNSIAIVFEEYDPQVGGNATIYLTTFEPSSNGYYEQVFFDAVATYSNSYYGNAKPAVSYTQYEIFIAYRTYSAGAIKQRTLFSDGGPYYDWLFGDSTDIPGTNANCINPSVTGRREPFNGFIFIVYENLGTIFFRQAARITHDWDFEHFNNGDQVNLSDRSGFNINHFPVISLANKNSSDSRYLMVSWLGIYNSQPDNPMPKEQGASEPLYREAAVVKTGYGTSWGTPSNFSNNVDFTSNGSPNTLYGSIMTWSESDGVYSKYVRRRTTTGYDPITLLSTNGIHTLVSNGSEFGNIKAMVFNNSESAPYFLNRCANDFTYIPDGMGKLTEAGIVDISYGRSGIVEKNGLEFVFNIGDVLLNGETVKFIERVDTLTITSIEELNASVRSDTLNLNPQSELIFSDYYYVVNAESADSLLSNEFNVNFKCELVKISTGEVVGEFENVNYNINNTEKYGSEGYLVDCSGIENGEYYLRLTTSVSEEVNLSLSDIQMDNVLLEKSNLQVRNFKGDGIPIEYALEQNYPNPFNPTTTIRYQLPKDGMVTLKVYDILGAEVVTLVNEEKVAGKYEVNFNAATLASGVYIYRLSVNDFVNVKKMVMLK